MNVSTKNPKHKYSMGGQELEETKEEKDIGVTVTKNLKPALQCGRAARTARGVLSQI